ncbi:hypothetical protein ACFPPA_16945 [Rhodanobacter ginsengisoli]|uniref:Uncharacterized protein n=1 Tax=Rhodanobacter ginsengisoli TaxID=418646 RepID=A0ABW0QV15_9GAMM
MTSLWKDLLFLHGHLVRKEDLTWRRDAAPESAAPEATPRSSPPAPSKAPSKEQGAAACA